MHSTQYSNAVDEKKVAKLKEEWTEIVEGGLALRNTRTGQLKILRKLPTVELIGKDHPRPKEIVCRRCLSYLERFDRATPEEREAFKQQEFPRYSSGWLVAPKVVDGKLQSEVFRCSCVVGRSLSTQYPFYDSQPEADPTATQIQLTALALKLQGELQTKEA